MLDSILSIKERLMMMIKRCLLLIACLLSFGCQSQSLVNSKTQLSKAVQEMNDSRSKCDEAFKLGEIHRYTQRANCINKAAMEIANKYSVPFVDITMVTNAYRSALAARLDASEITEKEASMIMGGAGYVLDAEENNRRFSKGSYPQEKWKSARELADQLNKQENTILGKNKIRCSWEDDFVKCE